MMVLDTATEVIAGAQIEITVFVLAVCMHVVLFGRNQWASKLPLSSKQLVQAEETPRESDEASAAVLPAMVREIRALLSAAAGQEDLAREMCKHLRAVSPELASAALVDLLELLGKAVRPQVLGAVRSASKQCGLSLDALLGTCLLKGYFGLRCQSAFWEALREVEEAEGGSTSPGTALLAMKAALHWNGDLEAAARRLPAVAPLWRCADNATPSAAPQGLLHQLLRLAASQAVLSSLLGRLAESGLLLPWVLEAFLAECDRAGDAEALQQALRRGGEAGVKLTAGAYPVLLRHAQDEEEALDLLRQAAARGLATKDVLLAAVKAGRPALARAALEALPKEPPAEVASALVRLAAAPGSSLAGECEGLQGSEAALRLYERRLLGAELGSEALRLVAEASLAQGREDLLRRLLAAPCDSPRRVALVKSLGVQGRLADAQTVFRLCPEKSVCLYNALLDACVEAGDLAAAERVKAEATAVDQADVITYNTIIKAHLQRGNLGQARVAMEASRAAGYTPNCVTYNELLDFAVKTSSEDAWGIVEEMKACGLKPNQVTCSILLKSIQPHSKAADVQRRMDVVEMFGDDMDEVLLSSVCEACVRAARPDLLKRPLQRQRTSRKVQIQGAHTYGSVIRAYGYVNDLQGVWDTWRELRGKSILPTNVTLGCMVEALVTNGEIEAGHRIIREMLREEAARPLVNSVVYCSVLKGFSHQKRFDRVWAIYEEMLSEKVQLTTATCNALVDACARCGEMRRLPSILQEMSRLGLQMNVVTCSAILKGYCQENSRAQLEKAFVLLDEMKRDLHFEPDEITYNTLLDGCARMGDFDRGVKLLRRMEASGVPPSNFTLSVLVKLANRSNRLEAAFELTEEITRKYSIRPNIHVYNNLIHACTQHRDLRRGLETFERMLSCKVRPDARSYTVLIRACIFAGEPQDVAGLLRAAAGLRGAHARTAGADPGLLKLRGGLPQDLVSEALEGIAAQCGDDTAAVHLLRELRRLPGMHVDPKLPMRLTAKAVGGQPRSR